VLGTTDYVSPEQALGHDVTGQSDLYSLGIVLFEMLTGAVPFRGENQVAVAMKHVREELPDVQALRPEVSASLAAVVDRATEKDLHERYRSDEELIADLEGVLALETARSGSATGEATTVLRTLPESTRRRIPLRVRSRRAWLAIAALVTVVAIAAGIVLSDRTHRGTGTGKTADQGAMAPIGLNSDAAQDYDPLGDSIEHGEQTAFAIDDNPATVWTTESYTTGDLQKDGVGIALDAAPAAVFRELRVRTPTPGFSAQVYVARDALPDRLPDAGWKLVGTADEVDGRHTIGLDTAGRRNRHVLLWITRLPAGEDRVEISQLTLYR
jgi:eukaryotic-like serine/threonine-protein kinase